MTEMPITVRGEATRRVAPELAVVHLAAHSQGADRGAVIERAASSAAGVREGLAGLHEAGAVSDWSSGTVTVWVERPWDGAGGRSGPEHFATIELTATFSDLSVVSGWIAEAAEDDGIRIASVTWSLTAATRTRIEREAAAAAIETAAERARAYAAAAGRSDVEIVEVADPGLLTGTGHGAGEQTGVARASLMSADPSGARLDLHPADIEVTASVDARFVAR